jgi:outer membrane lipoprotein LolB
VITVLWRARRLLAAMLLGALLVGCAGPATQPGDRPDYWSGRLALTLESEPPQSFFAGFTLTGSAQAGELSLTSPLGNTVALLQWQPGAATLRQGEQVRNYPSIGALAADVAGTPLPVPALFGWLSGEPQAVDGWQADLSRLREAGRLTARRLSPLPAAELRLMLDR